MTTSNATKRANSQATRLTPADRNAKLLAFRKCFTGNFTTAPVPSKTIPVASSRFATQ